MSLSAFFEMISFMHLKQTIYKHARERNICALWVMPWTFLEMQKLYVWVLRKWNYKYRMNNMFCEVCKWNQDLETSCVLWNVDGTFVRRKSALYIVSRQLWESESESERKVLLYELFAYAFPANESSNLSRPPNNF